MGGRLVLRVSQVFNAPLKAPVFHKFIFCPQIDGGIAMDGTRIGQIVIAFAFGHEGTPDTPFANIAICIKAQHMPCTAHQFMAPVGPG